MERRYRPREWARAGLSWPLCPAREIDQTEADAIIAAYGESWLRELYEEMIDGSLSTAPGATRQTDDV